MKTKILILLLILSFFSSCEKDKAPSNSVIPSPTLIGSWNYTKERFFNPETQTWGEWQTPPYNDKIDFIDSNNYKSYTNNVLIGENIYQFLPLENKLIMYNNNTDINYIRWDIINFTPIELILQRREEGNILRQNKLVKTIN